LEAQAKRRLAFSPAIAQGTRLRPSFAVPDCALAAKPVAAQQAIMLRVVRMALAAAACAAFLAFAAVAVVGYRRQELEQEEALDRMRQEHAAMVSQVAALASEVAELRSMGLSKSPSGQLRGGAAPEPAAPEPAALEPAAPLAVAQLRPDDAGGEKQSGDFTLEVVPLPRRLESFGYMEDVDAIGRSAGCAVVKKTMTLDMSTLACNGNNCPFCFLFKGPVPITLTITGCSTSKVGMHNQMGESSTFWQNAVQKFTFINGQPFSSATIIDGTSSSKSLAVDSHATAYCMQTAGVTADKFYWDAIVT